MSLKIIACMDRNRVIGLNGDMPWRLSADLKRFKALTMGGTVIMGSKTFDSIGMALGGRVNIVISRKTSLKLPGCIVVNSLEEALKQAVGETFIIGGGQIYEQAIAHASTMYLTIIDEGFVGDTFFPDFNKDGAQEWVETDRQDIVEDPTVYFSYSFVTLSRVVNKRKNKSKVK